MKAQEAIVRMLFDPSFAERVRRDPDATLPELPAALRAQLAAIDPRALKLDRQLRRRVLGTLYEEFKASTTLFLARTRSLVALEAFFASAQFVSAFARPLAFAFADFIEASPIERALAEARRMKPPKPDGRVHRAVGVVPIETTQGALAALQQAEQYLFEIGFLPPLPLCADAPPLVLDERTRDATPLHLVTVPTENGHSLVSIDEPTHALLASLPAPPHPVLEPLVDEEVAVQT